MTVATTDYFRKAETIADELREKIVSGIYIPGARLPTRAELTARYEVSNVTVQRALDRLRADGFIVADGRRGTFVADIPPHLTHYALLFARRTLASNSRNLFWDVLATASQELSNPRVRFSQYWGFEGRAGFLDYERLLADVRSDRVAGLIFASAPYALEDTPLLMEPRIPRVAFASNPKYGFPVVDTDYQGFARRALEYLYARGCRRPAIVTPPAAYVMSAETYGGLLAEFGMTSPDYWIQAGNLAEPRWSANLTRLLFHAADRPDSLLIANDNLVLDITRALHELGLIAPRDLHIVTHCNYPAPTPAAMPVVRLGFDVRSGLREAVRLIDEQRAGRMPRPISTLPPLFETELSQG